MSYSDLLRSLGFDLDPFAKTNADEEELLKSYFIEPPFFKAVYGDLSTPKSAVVFAPRGGGKTALKRMLELSSVNDRFMCVTYNRFGVAGLRLEDIDLSYHLAHLVRLLLVGILTSTVEFGITQLSSDDRHLIYLLTNKYLSEIDSTELKAAIESVQNFPDKAKEWWNKFTGPIGLVLNALLTKIGLGTAEIEKFSTAGGKLGQATEQIEFLGKLATKLGYRCTYVLIDKVDENSLTGASASNSYRFVAPLVSDLQLLELPNFGFKFFLWDMLVDDYRDVARPDRVKYYDLHWKTANLAEMLSKRLRAHSSERVDSLARISAEDAKANIDQAVALFSQGSPRNTIRICKEILDQQSEIDSTAHALSLQAIVRGFDVFAKNYTNEIFDEGIIRDLQKMRRADFTVKYIYTDVFRFTQQAGMTKVRSWQDAGVVKQIGVIQETRGYRPSNHYGVSNLLMLKHMFPDIPVFELMNQKIRTCSSCGQALVRDFDRAGEHTCESCQTTVTRVASVK
jgi:hypothetical protein